MDSAESQRPGEPEQAGTERDGPAAPSGRVLRRWIAKRDHMRGMAGPSPRQAAEFRLERAAATALARAAENQLHLPVFVEKLERSTITLAELPELLPERALLALVGGRRDALGVVAICPGLLASLIEMQAIGRVTSRPAQPRRPTRTDATISADFVNALLVELGRECATAAGCPDFGAFRYVTYMDDPRPLTVTLEDGEMTRLCFHLRTGTGGQRDGQLMIALPAETGTGRPPAADGQPQLPALQAATPAAAVPASLAAAVQDAPIRLTGILARRRLSLHQLRGLTPGALLPLPQSVLDEAWVETAQGQLLARGRLGEKDGFHAIRLRDACQHGAAADPGADGWRAGCTALHQDPPQPAGADLPPADLDDPDAFRMAQPMPPLAKPG